MLTKEERQYLIQVARQAIESAITKKPLPEFTDCPERLREHSGAFVTIHERGELRGCIGYTQAIKPLIETVTEVAGKAALEDPRFTPLTQDELPNIDIEISVLSPMKKIKEIGEIEVGKHGLMLEKGIYRGLLLPQVATEYGWDRETFLNQTSRKAGLPANAWKDPATTIFTFTADIFPQE